MQPDEQWTLVTIYCKKSFFFSALFIVLHNIDWWFSGISAKDTSTYLLNTSVHHTDWIPKIYIARYILILHYYLVGLTQEDREEYASFSANPYHLHKLLRMEFVMILQWVLVTGFNRMNFNGTRHWNSLHCVRELHVLALY